MSKQRKESTEVSVFPELIDNAHSDSFSLIIKHDYYSSDSDHGCFYFFDINKSH